MMAVRVQGTVSPADMEDVMQLEVSINPHHTSKANTNWDGPTVDTGALHNGYCRSSGAQNAEKTWDVVLPAGTYTVESLFRHLDSRGIAHIYIDSVQQGTIDTYNASNTYNQLGSVTGVVIAADGTYELKIKMATKNGSSSGYYGELSSVKLIRTSTAIA
jgi:hypothetical protein